MSPVSFKLSICWACFGPSAGPCRWLRSPATLMNNCSPAWRVGLRSDVGSLASQQQQCLYAGLGRLPSEVDMQGHPPSMSGTPMSACTTQSSFLHLPFKGQVQRLQLSFWNPGVNYGLSFS